MNEWERSKAHGNHHHHQCLIACMMMMMMMITWVTHHHRSLLHFDRWFFSASEIFFSFFDLIWFDLITIRSHISDICYIHYTCVCVLVMVMKFFFFNHLPMVHCHCYRLLPKVTYHEFPMQISMDILFYIERSWPQRPKLQLVAYCHQLLSDVLSQSRNIDLEFWIHNRWTPWKITIKN